MRIFFAALLLGLAALSLVMAKWSAPKDVRGAAPLVWTSDNNPLRAEQVALFNQLNPGIALTLDPSNEGMEKVIVQSMGGVGPDLFDCRDANQLSAYVRSGIALDVTVELKKRGIDVPAQTWVGVRALAVHEGKTYGFPTNLGATALWFNEDVIRRSGEKLPEGPSRWEDLIPVAKRLTKRDAKGRILQAGLLFDWYNWYHFVNGFGGRVFSEDGRVCTLDSKGVIAGVQLMQDLIYVHRVTPSPVEEAGMSAKGGWGADNINVFGAGRAALAIGGRWWLANLRKFEGLKLGVVESPTGGVRAFGTTGRATLVNSKSPNRENALRFLAYLASREYNELVNAQADGVCSVMKFARTEQFLHDPKHPEERYNHIWRNAAQFAVGPETSPFVNGQLANRIIDKQIDLVRIGQKSAKDAMRDAARQVNDAIRDTLEKFPSMRARYDALARGNP